ncbi:MAG: T9SS type A sorting domain-containing protein [Prolixibacteraceae bacterium]|nr:T9SS type A sorting domain-containing protein [Prolixibacteraceae bacterium]
MKNFYSIGLAVLFFALGAAVNGQKQRNEFTGVATEGNLLKSTTVYDLIRLKIENQYIYDATVIYYYDSFSDGLGREDSHKMFNSSDKIPEIFTRINNEAMAINGFSALNARSYIAVPVSVRNRIYDECTISALLEDFTDEYDVVLEDKELGQYTNLRTSVYSYTPSALGIENERFVLHLSRSARVITSVVDGFENEEPVMVTSDYGQINVRIDENLLAAPGPQASIDVYSLSGRMVTSRKAASGFNQIELASGQLYIVNVNVGNHRTTKKVAVR